MINKGRGVLNRTLKIRLTQDLRDSLRQQAEREQRSESHIIRRAIAADLAKRKPRTASGAFDPSADKVLIGGQVVKVTSRKVTIRKSNP